MNTQLEPYIPPHPNAPKRKTRSLSKTTVSLPGKLRKQYANKFSESSIKGAKIDLVISTFNETIRHMAVNSREGVLLPKRMGMVQVLAIRTNPTNRGLDAVMSEKLGVRVHYNGLKNDGKASFINNDLRSDSCDIPNKHLWDFKPSVNFSVEKRQAFNKDRKKFKDSDSNFSSKFRRKKFFQREHAKKKEEEILKTYNEFDFS
jgi:hypothetical protein